MIVLALAIMALIAAGLVAALVVLLTTGGDYDLRPGRAVAPPLLTGESRNASRAEGGFAPAAGRGPSSRSKPLTTGVPSPSFVEK
jgi:hypothetical protein